MSLGDLASQRPTDEVIRVTMAHPVLGFEVFDDGHVFVNSAIGDDHLPLSNRATVFLSIDGKYDAGACFGQGDDW